MAMEMVMVLKVQVTGWMVMEMVREWMVQVTLVLAVPRSRLHQPLVRKPEIELALTT